MTEDTTNLSIDVQTYGGVDVISAEGRIDSSNASQLDNKLKGLMEASRHKLVANLSGVKYMSSAGLRALVAAKRECSKNNGDVRISDPSDRVDEVLELAGLKSIFEIFDNDTAAVGSYT